MPPLATVARSTVDEAVRILIVDDHPVYRMSLVRVLSRHHGVCIVGEAGDGREGVSLARELRPDIMLVDLVMPELDGLGVLRELRDLQPAPMTILLSAGLTAEVASSARELGAQDAWSKAVPPREIAARVMAFHAARR